MIKNYEKIKQNVLMLSGQQDSEKVDLLIRALLGECLGYCYRDDCPPEMEEALSDVVATELNKRCLFGLDGDVSAYKEGDMSVSFAAGTATGGVKYGGQLEGFKVIRGVFGV